MEGLQGSELQDTLEAWESLQPAAQCPLSPCTASWHMLWTETWAIIADFIFPLCSLARAAITEYQSGLNNRKLSSHNSGGQKSKIQVSAELVSPEASHLGS